MKRKEKIEKCARWAKEILMFLSEVLGEMDAEQDYREYQRSKFKISVGGQAEKEDKKQE